MTEQQLKGVEASYLYPALYVPRTDEDMDKDGYLGNISEYLLSIFIHLLLPIILLQLVSLYINCLLFNKKLLISFYDLTNIVFLFIIIIKSLVMVFRCLL